MTINETGETSQYFRVDSALAYVTPNMGGFQAAAVVVADRESSVGEDADHYELVGKYTTGGLTVAAGLHEAAADAGTDVLALSAKYTMDAVTVAALYSDVDTDVSGSSSRNPYEIGATYTMGATKLIGTYYNQDAAVDTDGYNLEVQHKLGKQTTVYANYNSDDVAGTDNSDYGVGLRVDF
jgi:predicted porin